MESNKTTDEKLNKRLIKLGLKVAYYRKARGDMSAQQLADKADISVNLVWKLEGSGNPQSISLKTLFSIADALEIEPHKLLEN